MVDMKLLSTHLQSPQPRSLYSFTKRDISGLTRFPANESQKNRFALIYFGKIQFLPPCILISRSCRTASVHYIQYILTTRKPWLAMGMGTFVLVAYTDKKETKIFLIYKNIQNGAFAKSFMTNGLLIFGKIFAHFLIYQEALPQSSYMALQLIHSKIPNMRKIKFSSVYILFTVISPKTHQYVQYLRVFAT